MRPLHLRRLATLAAIPPLLATLTAFAPASVPTTGSAGTIPTLAGLSQRTELGIALVALGLLIAALTIVRVRIQARRRRAPATPASRWTRVTDTWGVYSVAASHRAELRSHF